MGSQSCLVEVSIFNLVISFLSPYGSMTPLGAKLLKYDTKVKEIGSKIFYLFIIP